MTSLMVGDTVAVYDRSLRHVGKIEKIVGAQAYVKLSVYEGWFYLKQIRLLKKKPRREFVIHINKSDAIYEAYSLEEGGHGCFREPGIECVRVIEKRRK